MLLLSLTVLVFLITVLDVKICKEYVMNVLKIVHNVTNFKAYLKMSCAILNGLLNQRHLETLTKGNFRILLHLETLTNRVQHFQAASIYFCEDCRTCLMP